MKRKSKIALAITTLSDTMDILVQEYQPSDRKLIKELVLHAENFGTPFLDNEMLRIDVFTAFPDYGRILVAIDSSNKRLVGYAAIKFDWKVLVINSIITHHEHLRQGVGRTMVDKIKEIGRKHLLIDVIRVDTGDFMDYAQQFYIANGFEKVGHVPHYMSWNNHQIIFVYHVEK